MSTVWRHEGPDGFLAVGPYCPPRSFFEEIVNPSVENFLIDQGSKLHAFNASVGLYHMTEYVCGFAEEHNVHWFPFPGEKNVADYRAALLEKCKEFGIAEAVALVYKHYTVTRNARAKKIAETIASVGRHVEILEGNIQMNEGWGIDFTKPYRARERTMVTTKDGTAYDLAEILLSVREMWRAELDAIHMDGRTPYELKPPEASGP